MPNQNSQNLIWIDLEMTGLDPKQDSILEIATIITDSKLKIIAEGPVIAIHHPADVLENMNEWCQKTHGESGLTTRVRESEISLSKAEQQSLTFVQQYVATGTSPLCGNSIWQDRRFLIQYMPQLEAHCHYRNIDVSTIKELARRWRPSVLAQVIKQDKHQALADIKESIAELQVYRDHLFNLDAK